MPDSLELAIDPTAEVSALIHELVYGDLLLRRSSLAQLGLGSAAPAILFARAMRGKLSVALTLTSQKKFLFFFKSHSDTDRIADIRVRFALSPSMAPRKRASEILGMDLEPPAYLGDSGDADRLHLLLTDNRLAVAQFHEDDTFNILSPSGESYHSHDTWPLNLFITLIAGMAEQIRTNESGNPRPFIAPADKALNRVLDRVTNSYREIIEVLDDTLNSAEIRTLDNRLCKLHPDLGGNYRFSELFCRILVWIGKDGALVFDRQEAEANQLDVEARFLPLGDNYSLRYRFRIPDMLVSGDYHRQFLLAVRSKEHAKKFQEKTKSITGKCSEEEYQDFLFHPNQDQSALFIRISRRTRLSRKDRDLVLLRGPLAGSTTELLFEAEFDVDPYPDIKVTDIDVNDLLGFRIGDHDWQWHGSPPVELAKNLPQQYMVRLVHTLRGWQKGMAEAATQ